MNPRHVKVTNAMYSVATNGTPRRDIVLRICLSPAAAKFVDDNDLGEFNFKWVGEDIMLEAPDEHAATLLRLAF